MSRTSINSSGKTVQSRIEPSGSNFSILAFRLLTSRLDRHFMERATLLDRNGGNEMNERRRQR